MELEQIFKIMEKFDASESSYLELQLADDYIKLKKPSNETVVQMASPNVVSMAAASPVAPVGAVGEADQAAGQAETTKTVDEKDYVKAPLVGVFYEASSPEQDPYVKVGSRVSKGDTLCLIEAMKMMNEVTAPKDGVVKEILVENGEMVEYDAPLFIIE